MSFDYPERQVPAPPRHSVSAAEQDAAHVAYAQPEPAVAEPVTLAAQPLAPPESGALTTEDPNAPRPAGAAKKNARGRRSSVPSWDEIMLGSSRQRD